jgi:DNA-binding response OmpR family regulator
MARILLVDDDTSLLDVLSMSFADAGYEVRTAPDGVAALESIAKSPPDVVVSDVNMPRLDGFSLCRRLREDGVTAAILLLTSRDNEIDEALGLELGADDYVVKPFSTRVLLARVAALLRRNAVRASPAPSAEQTLRSGELELSVERLEATYRGVPLVLTLTEFRLVEALVRRKAIVLSRDRLLEIVRGDDSVVAERIIDTYVRRLRRKFESIAPDFDAIETVIGAGYRWRA